MDADLFSTPPQYTIDTSSLIDIFGNDKLVSKEYTPGLWQNILELIAQGLMISHAEVLQEIKREGEELHRWARKNEPIFKDYDWGCEPAVIKTLSPKYSAFVNAKVSSVHADPWLIAQAKCRSLTIVSEERLSGSPNPANHKIPNVAADPTFGLKCIDLLGLVKERGWTFR